MVAPLSCVWPHIQRWDATEINSLQHFMTLSRWPCHEKISITLHTVMLSTLSIACTMSPRISTYALTMDSSLPCISHIASFGQNNSIAWKGHPRCLYLKTKQALNSLLLLFKNSISPFNVCLKYWNYCNCLYLIKFQLAKLSLQPDV